MTLTSPWRKPKSLFVLLVLVCQMPAMANEPDVVAGGGGGRQGKSVNVKFAGGPLHAYVETIQKQDPSLQVIITEGARGVMLPDIEIENIDSRNALGILVYCFDGNSKLEVSPWGDVYTVSSSVKSDEKELTILNLGEVLGLDVKRANGQNVSWEEEVDKFVKAIEVGLELTGEDASKPAVKIHKETSLFFVFGSPKQIAVIEKVAASLSGRPSPATKE